MRMGWEERGWGGNRHLWSPSACESHLCCFGLHLTNSRTIVSFWWFIPLCLMLTLQMLHFYSPLKARPCDEWHWLIKANSASSGGSRDTDEYHIGTINLSVQFMILHGTHCAHGPALKRISNKTNQKKVLDENVFVTWNCWHILTPWIIPELGRKNVKPDFPQLQSWHNNIPAFWWHHHVVKPRTLFPVNMTSSKATFWIIHWFYLSRAQTLGWNKSLSCKQSSPDFKHVITTVPLFVIIEHHNAFGTELGRKSHIMALHGTQVQTQASYTEDRWAEQRRQQSVMHSQRVWFSLNEVHLSQ